MKTIKLNLPPGAVVVGELLEDYSRNLRRLTQDILQVTFPGGQGIDVAWFPEFDPNGHFQIVVFEGEWENQIGDPIEARTPGAAAKAIQEIASRLTQPKRPKDVIVPR